MRATPPLLGGFPIASCWQSAGRAGLGQVMNLWTGLAERQIGGAEEGRVSFEIASKGKLCRIALRETDGAGGWGKRVLWLKGVFLPGCRQEGQPKRLTKRVLLFSITDFFLIYRSLKYKEEWESQGGKKCRMKREKEEKSLNLSLFSAVE